MENDNIQFVIEGDPFKNTDKGKRTIKDVFKQVLEQDIVHENPLTGEEEVNKPLYFVCCKIVNSAMRGENRSAEMLFERLEGKAQQSVQIEADVKTRTIRVGYGQPKDE